MPTATQVKIRRSTAAVLNAATPAEGELGFDLSNKKLVAGDGVTPGGIPHATEAYVQTQIAALTAGNAANLINWLTCT